MGRWEPGASGRLREAALALYLEHGFEQTMVADIAERAGVTARTFFRYFADKREVLFDASAEVGEKSLAALAAAPATASPLELVAAALDAVVDIIGRDRELARKRHEVIMANADLRERELSKLAHISTALADGLRRRGIGETEAALAAETGCAVYRVAFQRWVDAADDLDLREAVRRSFAQLRAFSRNGSLPERRHTVGVFDPAQRAADLINLLVPAVPSAAEVTEVLLAHGESEPIGLTEPDVLELREAAFVLREIFAAQDVAEAAERLNDTLARYARPPRLTAHGGASPWHLHVDSHDDAPWGEWLLTSSCLALATLLGERQAPPGGVCAAAGCGKSFVDTGRGSARRYCSARCATRERVAAHRVRSSGRPASRSTS